MNCKNFIIYSEKNNGTDDFYVVTSHNSRHYLFNSKRHNSVHEFFKSGVYYNKAIDFSLAKRNYRICHIMERIPSAVRYVYKEFLSA